MSTLAWIVLSGLLMSAIALVGSVIAYVASRRLDVTFLIPFAAGNFLYIGAADLIPEIKKDQRLGANLIHFTALLTGLGVLLGVRLLVHG